MSSLDKDLEQKFGKSNKKLRDMYRAYDLDNNSLHGHDVKDGKAYWDALESKKQYDSEQLLEKNRANPDVEAETSTPYSREGSAVEFDDLIEKMPYLNRIEKEIIQLLWEGRTQEEIGIVLNMKRVTVATHLDRAKKKILRSVNKKGF